MKRWKAEHGWLVAVTALSLALNSWALSLNGLGNQYYAAAARSMSGDLRLFFFASLDPGGFISVDKPPVQLWIEAASARLFGVNSWSLLLPSALAGAATVALLWCTVRRRFGVTAATVAGLVLALSPVSVAVDRLNLPEPFLILFLVATAWAALRALDADRPLRWLALAGAFAGLAFNTKMLAAYIPLPAVALAIAVGLRGWWPKVRGVLTFSAATLAASLPWLVIVDLVPAAARPYVGGSTDNTVWDLVVGYNGLGRITGGGALGGGGPGGPGGPGAMAGAGGGPGGAMSGAGGIFGGSPGPLRLFSDAVGGQIGWFLVLAALGAALAAWVHRRQRHERAAVVLWAGWLLLYGVTFSKAAGTFHAYYTATMAPAVAALVGIGAAAALVLVRRHPAWLAVAAAGLLVTAAVEVGLAARAPAFYPWARPLAMALVVLALGGIVAAVAARRLDVLHGALAVGLAGLLVLPGVWALSETANPVLNATLPQAGPRQGSAGSSFGSASSNGDPALAAYLQARHTTETWDLVVGSAQTASGLIADQGVPVLAVGGFMGTDPTLTVDRFADLVDAGQVRFVLTSAGRGPATGGGQGASAGRVLAAARQACTPVATADDGVTLPSAYAGSLYDCAGAADALRAAA